MKTDLTYVIPARQTILSLFQQQHPPLHRSSFWDELFSPTDDMNRCLVFQPQPSNLSRHSLDPSAEPLDWDFSWCLTHPTNRHTIPEDSSWTSYRIQKYLSAPIFSPHLRALSNPHRGDLSLYGAFLRFRGHLNLLAALSQWTSRLEFGEANLHFHILVKSYRPTWLCVLSSFRIWPSYHSNSLARAGFDPRIWNPILKLD